MVRLCIAVQGLHHNCTVEAGDGLLDKAHIGKKTLLRILPIHKRAKQLSSSQAIDQGGYSKRMKRRSLYVGQSRKLLPRLEIYNADGLLTPAIHVRLNYFRMLVLITWLIPCFLALGHLHSSHSAAGDARQDCSRDNVNPTSQCWNTLNVSGYLSDWWTKNQETCNTYPYKGMGFASCYQQLNGQGRLLGLGCNEVGLSCEKPPVFDTSHPEDYYVLQSIYGLWRWFNSIWYAVEDSTLVANSKIGQIVNEVNPVKPGATSLGVVLSALTAGFAFLAVPAQLEVTLGVQVATQAATALQQAPGLGKALLPTGTLDSEFKQLTSIQDSLGQVLTQSQTNTANALKSHQDDYELFSNLAANGASIVLDQPSLNVTTTKITSVLNSS